MKHKFKRMCIDVNELLDGVNKFSTFISRARKQANKQEQVNPGYWPADTYFGEAFEAMCEVFINASPIDKRVNIVNYSPNQGADMGIDGVGRSHNGRIHTVQCKAKSNSQAQLTANRDHLSNFVANSQTKYGSEIEMTIMTSGNQVNHKILNEMYSGKVNTITNKEFKKFLDGNAEFWNLFKAELLSP